MKYIVYRREGGFEAAREREGLIMSPSLPHPMEMDLDNPRGSQVTDLKTVRPGTILAQTEDALYRVNVKGKSVSKPLKTSDKVSESELDLTRKIVKQLFGDTTLHVESAHAFDETPIASALSHRSKKKILSEINDLDVSEAKNLYDALEDLDHSDQVTAEQRPFYSMLWMESARRIKDTY
ncbi:MAG: hypothetical protein GF334_00315 [Candidatus Altiarchaeales archaeon]|nr:hypothetical protein [Candidatus Altiarchaeales archaeon]